MKQDVIISIRHPFAEKIYSGEKLYEFRKRRPNIAVGTRCWIYEPLPIGKVTGFFIYRGCYRDEKAKVWEHCQEDAGINREAFMQYYDRDFYAHAWQVGTARRCPAFDLKEAGIDRAPQSYITWSSEFLDNLIITMNERKELNDKLRDLILEIRGKKGFAAYRVGNGLLSMSELIKDDGKLLMIKPWEPDSHSQRIHITLKVSPDALESTKEGLDLLLVCLAFAMFGWLLSGCTTKKYVPNTETRMEHHWHTDTVKERDSTHTERNTVIRELDSAAMAKYGIQMESNQRAWLVLQREMENRLRELEHMTAQRDTVRDSIHVPYPVTEYVERKRSALEWVLLITGIVALLGGIVWIAWRLKRFLP